MPLGAVTPEELETMLEDAFVVRDRRALAGLFECSAVLTMSGVRAQARGVEEIEAVVSAAWEGGCMFVAAPERVIQARDTALVLGPLHTAVLHRAGDGAWRYAISLLTLADRVADDERAH